ncbi:lytic murein transglycosylase [Planktotalea arctica]|uniref:lytic murein transglycosylase n=1 Tax=Planktotalea arctica TaxID=1481893 RepID=UPI000A17408D|nr:lytic murein transglycosylase [Planktotalea arctica]
MRALSFGLCFTLALVGSASAGLVERSLRPEMRPSSEAPVAAQTAAVAVAIRPIARPAVVTKERAVTPAAILAATSNAGFKRWVSGFRGRALRAGISATVFERSFRGVQYLDNVIKRDRNQSEFSKTIWDYLDSAASDTRIANGKAALAQHRAKLNAIEARYGVEKEVVVAVWGLESAYGAFRGNTPIVSALATLSYDGRRGQFFESQLIAALKILQAGDTSPENMTGSWAGAMGHTQFIPTSYLDYAVDFTGDGRRDIWADDPSDALASTAAYLSRFGWETGVPWGVEVTLPRGFDYDLASRKIKKSPTDWAALGVIGANGKAVPNHGAGSILLPAGARGVALMVFKNFKVIERYNAADAYVIGVGHLSDRIGGSGPFKADWPREDRALTFVERQQMQRLLSAAGFNTKGVDGKVGPKTIAAIKDFQRSVGMVPDGYASLDLLKRLR